MAEGQSKNKVNLKIDCSRLSKKEITTLRDSLEKYISVIVAGWSLIFATGEITFGVYNEIWQILDKYDVIVD